MTSARFTVSGIERLSLKLSRRSDVLKGYEMRAIMQRAGGDLLIAFRGNIESFSPGPVRDLADSTKKQKMRKVGFIYPILRRTSQMMNSMLVSVSNPRKGGWSLALGFVGSQDGTTNETIANAHIKGTSRVPKRDFTKVPSSWKSNLIRRIRDAIQQR